MEKKTDWNAPYFRAKDAARYLGVSKSTFYLRIANGDISRGIKLSPACVIWKREELDAYIDRCASS